METWKVYEDIKTNPMLKSAFLSASEHRLLYFKIVQCTSDEMYSQLFCRRNNDVKRKFVEIFFNCVAKNLAKDLSQPVDNKKRKTKKLMSEK